MNGADDASMDRIAGMLAAHQVIITRLLLAQLTDAKTPIKAADKLQADFMSDLSNSDFWSAAETDEEQESGDRVQECAADEIATIMRTVTGALRQLGG